MENTHTNHNSFLTKKHRSIAQILWDEPVDITSIKNSFKKNCSSQREADAQWASLTPLLSELIKKNWIDIKHSLFCLTPLGRRALKNAQNNKTSTR